jgi:hypothetical protein
MTKLKTNKTFIKWPKLKIKIIKTKIKISKTKRINLSYFEKVRKKNLIFIKTNFLLNKTIKKINTHVKLNE